MRRDRRLSGVLHVLGSPPLRVIGNRTEAPGCLVEQAVNTGRGTSVRDAEALLLARLGKVTLAELAAAVRTRGRLPEGELRCSTTS